MGNLAVVDFKATPNATSDQVYKGFSERFNELLDNCKLEIPALEANRVTWVAETFEVTIPSASNWIKKDRPPADGNKTADQDKACLYMMVDALFPYLDGRLKTNPRRILGWLRYGEDACPSPFGSKEKQISQVAKQIVEELCDELGTDKKVLDDSRLLEHTEALLAGKGITNKKGLDEIDLMTIKSFINMAAS